MPAFKPVPDTGEPLLPDLDIDVRGVRVHRLIFEPAITGERQVATIGGSIAIADRRAQVRALAKAIGNGAKGDRLALLLDAVPDRNRLAMRSEERRVGNECVSQGRSRWSPDP